ncbi:MAG: hypothetical protein JNJ41_13480 [Bacteroidia bacterium]|nr:hypothetical protein [Bacteroidia bacterium]
MKNNKGSNNVLLIAMFMLAIGIVFFFYAVVGFIMGLNEQLIVIRGQEMPFVDGAVFWLSLIISILSFVFGYLFIKLSRR